MLKTIKNGKVESSTNNKNHTFIIIILLFIASLLYFPEIPSVLAISDSYSADFETTTYKDTLNTNVTGWEVGGSGYLRNPYQKPKYLGHYGSHSHDVFISGSYAYVAAYSNGLRIMDVSDPSSPSLTGSYDTSGYSVAVYVLGSYAYVADLASGLLIFNIANPSSPSLVGTYSTTGDAEDVFVVGDYAYVADDDNGLLIIDVSIKSSPGLIGSWNDISYTWGVHVSGNYAYLAAAFGGLQIIDITSKASPFKVGQEAVPDRAYGVFVEGNYAYVAAHDDGLIIMDVSTKTNPTIVSTSNTPESAHGVFVSNDFAYVADNEGGLQIFRVISPSNPQFISSYDPTPLYMSYSYNIVVDSNKAYLADSWGLYILDVSQMGKYSESAVAQSLTVTSISSDTKLKNATLTAFYSSDGPTTITYYLSPDDGLHWEQVTLGVLYDFINTGYQLRWKAILSTTDTTQTPWLYGITIDYNYVPHPPILSTPMNNSYINDNTPTLTWTSVSSASSYYIEIDTSMNFDSMDLRTGSSITTDYTPSSTLSDDKWYWRVASNDSEGDLGEFSGVNNFFVDTILPGSPSLISPNNNTVINDNTPLFTWSSVVDAINYTLQCDTSLTFSSPDLKTNTSSTTNCTLFVPLFDGEWYWRVCAYDNASNQGLYSIPYALTIDTIPPSSPTLLSPFNNTITDENTPLFTWSSVVDAINYTLQLDTSLTFSSLELITVVGITSTSYLRTTPLNDATWYWRVRTFDYAHNQGPYSDPFTLIIDTTAPGAPILLSPPNNTFTNDDTPLFTWSSVIDARNHTLQLDTSLSFSSLELITVVGITSTSYLRTSSLADATWYWRVRTFDYAHNQGPYSDPFTLIIDTTAPGAPILLSPPNNTFTNDDTPLFTWSSVIDAINYTLQLDTSLTFSSLELITVVGITSTSYLRTTSLADATWYWRVCAYDGANNQGIYSNPYFLNIDTIAPNPPILISPLNNSVIFTNKPSFNWSSVFEADHYNLEIDTEKTFSSPNLIKVFYISSTNFTSTTQLFDGVWFWRVQAVDKASNHGSFAFPYELNINAFVLLTPSLTLPSNNTLININTTTFYWDSLSGVQNYTLQLDTSHYFNSSNFINIEGIVTEYYSLITELIDGSWYWRICGYNTFNAQSQFSLPFTLRIDTIPPDPPEIISPITGALIGYQDIPFEWNSVFDASSYNFQLDDSNEFINPLVDVNNIYSVQYTLINTLGEGIWYWRVQAVDDAGNLGLYSTVDYIIIDKTGPNIEGFGSTFETSQRDEVDYINVRVSDNYPDTYIVTRDGVLIQNGTWSNNIEVPVELNYSIVGTFIIECTFYDKAGNENSRSMTLTIYSQEIPPPHAIPFSLLWFQVGLIGLVILIITKTKRTITKN